MRAKKNKRVLLRLALFLVMGLGLFYVLKNIAFKPMIQVYGALRILLVSSEKDQVKNISIYEYLPENSQFNAYEVPFDGVFVSAIIPGSYRAKALIELSWQENNNLDLFSRSLEKAMGMRFNWVMVVPEKARFGPNMVIQLAGLSLKGELSVPDWIKISFMTQKLEKAKKEVKLSEQPIWSEVIVVDTFTERRFDPDRFDLWYESFVPVVSPILRELSVAVVNQTGKDGEALEWSRIVTHQGFIPRMATSERQTNETSKITVFRQDWQGIDLLKLFKQNFNLVTELGETTNYRTEAVIFLGEDQK